MSLTGADIGVNKALLTSILPDSGTLDRLSGGGGGGDARITRSCDIATDEFRDAAIKGGYDSAAIDALTDTTLHVRWREYIAWYAIDDISVGIGVPEDLRKRCEDAKKHFSFLATGNSTIDGLTKITDTGGVVSQGPIERTFDRCNSSQSYALRNPKI
jgi:hypothetical protein